MAKDTTEALAVPEPSAMTATTFAQDRPDYIKDSRLGVESITKDDMLVPRLALAQALSPEVTEGDPRMIAGMKPGDLFNSVTKQNYGREVFIQIIRKDRLRAMQFNAIEDGGGVLDPDVPLDDDRCHWHGNNKPEATVFRDYLSVILPSRELIALSFKGSGIKVAKQLNGLIALRGADIFAGIYRITTDTHLQPKPHKVYKVENAGWASPVDLERGGHMWDALKDLDVEIERGVGRTDDPTETVPF